MTLYILFGMLAITMILGVPVAWALGISAFVAFLNMGFNLTIVPQKIFSGLDFYTLLTIPLFIVAGEFMTHGGITERLLRFALIGVGWVRGGGLPMRMFSPVCYLGVSQEQPLPMPQPLVRLKFP